MLSVAVYMGVLRPAAIASETRTRVWMAAEEAVDGGGRRHHRWLL
jgi:hypothetical protein